MNAPFKFIATLLLCLVPGFAFAGLISPPGGTDWDMYVYGNARVIFDILNSVKMLVNPAVGNSGFKSLLLLLATIGFVVLAISAGFDPAKNFLKMFTYILVVWFISFGTTGLTANVVIQDQSRATGMFGVDPVYRVDAVPALIVMPAVLTSLVGKYFTESIETYFTMPSELKMSGGAVGQYNLFGRMQQESAQYILTSPELKRSVSQYMGDCVIPAMALGQFKGLVPDGLTPGGTVMGYGTSAMVRSTNLWKTLESAGNKSILTKYYPFDVNDIEWASVAGSEVADLSFSPTSNASYMSTGVLMSCASAYSVLTGDMTKHAQLLLQQGAEAWARSGVQVTFPIAMQTMLTQSGATGTAGQPSGYIMQTALMNTVSGAFRQAAIQTGNNVALTSVQLAQAEQSQWSSWSAGFSTFNNMMGYVFTVLQAFIFAITPLIIVALMIPGMGKAIFVNYAQILVWLTLWMPMLAIINFLITLYGSESVSTVVHMDGGPSLGNKAVMSQAVNHQMLAAQFLGGMVPMIAWGIVKGAMAFTEFINHGIGNQFAAAAGAGAATGNLSLNNMSMDNASMNKFSTMQSSQVGSQAVSSSVGAGALTNINDLGGQGTKANAASANIKQATSQALQETLGKTEAVGKALTAMQTGSMTIGDLYSKAAGHSNSDAETAAAQQVLSKVLNAAVSKGTVTQREANDVIQSTVQNQFSEKGGRTDATTAGLTPGVAGASAGVNFKSDHSTDGTKAVAAGRVGSAGDKTGTDVKAGTGTQMSDQNSRTLQKALGDTSDKGERASIDKSTQYQEAVSRALSSTTTMTESLQASLTASRSMDFSEGVGTWQYAQMRETIASAQKMTSPDALRAEMTTMTNNLDGRVAAYDTNRNAQSAANADNLARLGANVQAGGTPAFPSTPTDSEFKGFTADANAQFAAGNAAVDNKNAVVKGANGSVDKLATNAIDVNGLNGVKTGAKGIVDQFTSIFK